MTNLFYYGIAINDLIPKTLKNWRAARAVYGSTKACKNRVINI